jgi:hypothetical protein
MRLPRAAGGSLLAYGGFVVRRAGLDRCPQTAFLAGFEEDVTAVPSSGRLLRPRYGGIVPTLGELSIVVRRALRKVEHDKILALAKALVFTVFLSVPALALAAFGMVSLLWQPADVRRFFALHQLRVVPVAVRHPAEQSLVTVTTSSHVGCDREDERVAAVHRMGRDDRFFGMEGGVRHHCVLMERHTIDDNHRH